MNPDVKAQWTAALRSGQYKQGTSWLNPEPGFFCCLGVLCDISGQGTWKPVAGQELSNLYDCETDRESTTLPNEVMEWASIMDYAVMADLASMNDNGNTFAEIADWIEENL